MRTPRAENRSSFHCRTLQFRLHFASNAIMIERAGQAQIEAPFRVPGQYFS